MDESLLSRVTAGSIKVQTNKATYLSKMANSQKSRGTASKQIALIFKTKENKS